VTRERLTFAYGLACLLLADATGAYAADAAQPAKAANEGDSAGDQSALLEEIVVTGSRAALPGFSASTPTTVVDSDVLARESAPNLAQILNEVPGFKATQSPASNGVKTGTPGSFTADLRGLGGQRTLVLVDGLRAPPTAPATNTSVVATVDLNTIPALMVDRVEVVTGGASAQWGSDAVAGVVNVILRRDASGIETSAKLGGATDGGDQAVFDAYHAGLLPPFCFSAAKSFFDSK